MGDETDMNEENLEAKIKRRSSWVTPEKLERKSLKHSLQVESSQKLFSLDGDSSSTTKTSKRCGRMSDITACVHFKLSICHIN